MQLWCASQAAERARKEVLFWKNELDDVVAEKNIWKDRFYNVYRGVDGLQQAVLRLQRENEELKYVLDRTLKDDLKARMQGGVSTPSSGASSPVSMTPLYPAPVVCSCSVVTPDTVALRHCMSDGLIALPRYGEHSIALLVM